MKRLLPLLLVLVLSGCASLENQYRYSKPGPFFAAVLHREPGCTLVWPARNDRPPGAVLWGFGPVGLEMGSDPLALQWLSYGVSVVASEAATDASLAECYRQFSPRWSGDGTIESEGAVFVAHGIAGARLPSAEGLIMVATSNIARPRLNAGFGLRALGAKNARVLLVARAAEPLPGELDYASALTKAGISVFWVRRDGGKPGEVLSEAQFRWLTTAWLQFNDHAPGANTLFEGDECGLCASPDWKVWRSGDWRPRSWTVDAELAAGE